MNDKAQGLSIRKLTRSNPTMKAAFAEAREECAPPDVYASRLGVSAKVITRSNAVKATTNGHRVGRIGADRVGIRRAQPARCLLGPVRQGWIQSRGA